MKRLTIMLIALATPAFADPCGMVTPFFQDGPVPITRIGEQQTYVFFKDGVESFVIRPGFRGKIDEFGMLIPFPTPPAIRKVADHIFPHVAAAVDPPEVVINLMMRNRFSRARGGRVTASMSNALSLRKSEVRVISEEAVGMYEVAVLEAGSSAALKKWMDKHEYRFPDGMETTCGDYITDGWCFVAVKTKVGPKSGVDPKPGQRQVKPKMAAGSSFDGFVQAMGFRFKTKELVVPMRLSAFNEGETRNVVYLLTDGPRKIRSIPEEFVRRQIDGPQLVKNLTNPLPLRIIGGKLNDIMQKDQAAGVRRIMPAYGHNLKERRDPRPKNGAARELFAADLVAVDSGELALKHEETEKTLLKIGERMGLRGGEIDKLNAEQMTVELADTVAAASELMKKMTLTVVDGDFPREVLAKQNLTFGTYTMAANKNNPETYDALQKRANPKARANGTLILESVSQLEIPLRWYERGISHMVQSAAPFGLVGLGAIAFCFAGPSRKRNWLALLLVACVVGTFAPQRVAAEAAAVAKPSKPAVPLDPMVADLANPKTAEAAVDRLVKSARGSADERDKIVAALAKAASNEGDAAARGWAISALGEISGMDVDETLLKIQVNKENSKLVRTWAAAARVTMCRSSEALIEKAQLIAEFPALGRPIGKRIVDEMEGDGALTAEQMLQATMKVPQIAGALTPAIMALGADKLITAMTSAEDQQVRRQAAAYIGTIARQDSENVAKATLEAYSFKAGASDVPWSGGPLFVPGMQWNKEDAGSLVSSLMAWNVWAEEKGKTDLQRQIHNNIRSVGLSRVVGYATPNFQFASAPEWLGAWGKTAGKEAVTALLAEQGLENNAKYKKVLDEL